MTENRTTCNFFCYDLVHYQTILLAALSYVVFCCYKPILCHWSLAILHENIRKPEVFQCFRGVKHETSGMQ